MDSRICQTFPASPAEPGGLLGALASDAKTDGSLARFQSVVVPFSE